MKIAVLGAGGYIGSVLTRNLLLSNHKVVAIDRFYFGKDVLKPDKNLTILQKDIRALESKDLADVIVVFDVAGISNDPACDLNPKITEDINFEGMVNAAYTASHAGVQQYIYSSSCSVYGDSNETWVDEKSKPNPVSLYAKTKLKCERFLLGMHPENFKVTIFRNATVFGLSPRMRFDLIVNLMTLHAYKHGKIHVLGGGNQWRPLVHIQDLCGIYKQTLQMDTDVIGGQIYNLGCTNRNYQVIEIAKMVRDRLPMTELLMAPDDDDKRSYRVNCDKLNDVFAPTTFNYPQAGIRTIHEALQNGAVAESIKTNTVGFYKYLLEAEKLVKELSHEGRIF